MPTSGQRYLRKRAARARAWLASDELVRKKYLYFVLSESLEDVEPNDTCGTRWLLEPITTTRNENVGWPKS